MSTIITRTHYLCAYVVFATKRPKQYSYANVLMWYPFVDWEYGFLFPHQYRLSRDKSSIKCGRRKEKDFVLGAVALDIKTAQRNKDRLQEGERVRVLLTAVSIPSGRDIFIALSSLPLCKGENKNLSVCESPLKLTSAMQTSFSNPLHLYFSLLKCGW